MSESVTDTTQPEAEYNSLDAEQVGYKQSLGRRHVQMIAIGGAIGTGLFLGSASRLHSTGPALLFSYAFVGVIAYFLMRALGELVLHRADVGRVRVLHARVLRREGRLRHRLDVLAELGADRHRRALGRGPVRPVLVPDDADLGDRAHRARRRAGHQPALGPRLRRVRVLGRRPEGRRDRRLPRRRHRRRGLRLDIGGHKAGIPEPVEQPRRILAERVAPSPGTARSSSCPGVVFAYAAIEMVGVAAGEMEDSEGRSRRRSTPSSSGSRVFYCGSILLLVSMLPTSEYKAGISPFVTIFDRMGLDWMGDAHPGDPHRRGDVQPQLRPVLHRSGPAQPRHVQAGAGLHPEDEQLGRAVGRHRHDLGRLRLRRRPQRPHPGRLRDRPGGGRASASSSPGGRSSSASCGSGKLVNLGRHPARARSRRPGHPWTSYVGLAFLVLVVVGMAISGWQSSPYFWHKTDFVVVVFGIPLIAVVLELGWLVVRTQGRREHRRPAQGGVVRRPARPTGRRVARRSRRRSTRGQSRRSTPDRPATVEEDSMTSIRRARLVQRGRCRRARRRGRRAACCSSASDPPDDRPRRRPARGKLTIGIAFDQPGLGAQGRRHLQRLRRRHRDLCRRGSSACRRRTSPGRRPTRPSARTLLDRRRGRPGRSPPSRSPTSASRRSTSPGPTSWPTRTCWSGATTRTSPARRP